MARQYVTDMIGDEYMTWKEKDQIILATQTGSGKTTFVISRLLKHAVSMGKHVVYYCNRRVLRDQFQIQSQNLIRQVFGTDLGLAEDAVKYLHIFTYQGAEDAGNYPHIHFLVAEAHDEVFTFDQHENGLQVQLRAHKADEYEHVASSEIMYYIFDEAHYFLSDSLIRHESNFWAKRELNHGISVFLTATPKPLHLFLAMRSGLPFSNDFTHVHSKLARKTELENNYYHVEALITSILENWKIYDKISFTLKDSPERRDAFMRRWGSPLNRFFSYIEQALQEAEPHPHYYRTKPDYSYLDVRYFTAYEDLLLRIAQTPDDKWMIFVDSEAAGNELHKMLQEAELGSAAFLSSTRVKSNDDAKMVYAHIVAHQKFPCRILISTSVMDCGTNIHDPAVRHMVIASDNETTFLQELGRKRISDGERLQLYIQVYSYKQIHTRYYQLFDKLMFMINLGLKNRLNASHSKSYLSKAQMNQLHKEIHSGHRANLTMQEDELTYFHSKNEQIPILPEYIKKSNIAIQMDGITYSRTAMTHVVHRLYDYHKAMTTYREEIGLGKELVDFIYEFYMDDWYANLTFAEKVDRYSYARDTVGYMNPHLVRWRNMLKHKSEHGELDFDFKIQRDDNFYLKHQLKWIGKEYDPSCWLFDAEKRMELITLLDLASESRPLRQGGTYCEQDEFASQCIDLMLSLPVPPKQLHRNRSRYKNGKLPGINLLNKYLQELGLPYEIDGNKRELFEGIEKKKTVWTVKRKDTEEPSEEDASPNE